MSIISSREEKIWDFKNFTQAINGFITKEGVTTLPAPDVIDQYVPYSEAKTGLGKDTRIISASEAMILSQLAYFDFSNFKNELGLSDPENTKTLREIATDLYVDPHNTEGTPLNDFKQFGDLTNAEKNEILKNIADGKYPGISNLVVSRIYKDPSCDYDAISFFDKNNPNALVIANTGSQGSQVGN